MLMIIYGVITYQPIAALFIAGILPGLLLFLALALVVFLVGVFSELPKERWKTWRESRRRLASGFVPGIIPIIVIVGIISGAMTPTESGAVAAIVALFLGVFVYRKIKLRDIFEILQSVALSTAVITSLIAAASTFGWALSFEGAPDRLVEAITAMTDSPLVFLILVNLLMLLLGMFLETISVQIIIVPILLPAVQAMGIDLIQFGVVVCLGTVVGLVTPPVGPGLYVAMMEGDTPLRDIIYWVIPFLVAVFITMAVVAMFPALSVWLPAAVGLL
jgi:tripartite ATP-independent transporter DctM subunit